MISQNAWCGFCLFGFLFRKKQNVSLYPATMSCDLQHAQEEFKQKTKDELVGFKNLELVTEL